MKQPPEYFEGADPQLVYIAKKLSDATHLESILTAGGIDYGVEADEYQGGVIFRRIRTGAFFYVRPEALDSAVSVMTEAGYVPAATQTAGRGLQ